MSVLLKPLYSINQEGDTVTVLDNTGQYSSLLLYSWGSPNPDISTVLSSHIDVSKRNADGTFGTTSIIDVYPTLPSDIGASYDISAADAGQGTVFSDGIYKFYYYVAGNDGTAYAYSVTTYKAFHPAIDCCYAKLSAKYAACDCGCKELEEQLNQFTINMLLLEKAKCNGDLQSIQKYIDYLTDLCTECSCGCN